MNKKQKILVSIIVFVMFFTAFAIANAKEENNKFSAVSIPNEGKQSEIYNSNKDLQEEALEKENNTDGISAIAVDPYEGTAIEDKNNMSKTYVERDGKHYTYSRSNGLNFISIERFCFETGEFETIFTNFKANIEVESVRGYYVKDKVIYTAFYDTREYEKLRIIGYDTQTETICYNQTFPVTGDEIYSGNFLVDSNQNFYFLLEGENETDATIASFDKNGNAIDSITQPFLTGYINVQLTGANQEGTALFFALQARSIWGGTYWNDFLIKIDDNGKFIEDGIYNVRQYGGMIFEFLDDTHVYDQYGDFYELDFHADNETGIQYTLKYTMTMDGTYINSGYLYTSDDTHLYMGTTKGMLYIFNWKTYEIEKVLTIGDKKTITGVYKTDGDDIFIEYWNSADSKYYSLKLNISDFKNVKKNELITQHTSLTHSKADIKNKYEELKIKYNNSSNIYEQAPSIKKPYLAGTLRSEVKQDTINQINYFRWLAGLNSITQNNQYMEYSQKGAVVLAANRILTHTPAQPTDMDSEFYQQGYNATNARIGTSANISKGSLLPESIKGYIDDTSNMEPDVGHRSSLLSKNAQSASFGYAEGYGVVNIFTDNSITNPDIYHAWPSPGYMPIESSNVNALWSIEISDTSYRFSSSKIILKANGKEYNSLEDFEVQFDSFYNTYYFKIPDELKEYLTNGQREIQNGKSVEVQITGISDDYGNTYIIQYPVNFFSLNKVLTGISLPKTSSIVIGTNRKLELTLQPTGAIPDGTIKWNSNNPTVLSISQDGTITANKLGKATITAEVDGYKATCEIEVVDWLLGDMNKDGSVNSVDAALVLDRYINKDATAEDIAIGDMDGKGDLNATDAALIIDLYSKN